MKALITGITGQDGSYLAELLLSKGYEVFGLVRRTSNDPFMRMSQGIRTKIRVIYGDLRDRATVERAIAESMPDEIYNLAAQSDVGISFKIPEETLEINYHGLERLVLAMQKIQPAAKLYQASSSEMFGKTPPKQNEHSSFNPVSPYGVSKVRAYKDFIEDYRRKYGLFLASGFLFNHESPRRGEHFVTRKITISLAKIQLGMQECLELGNLDAKRDWGFAEDYVEAMWRILQQPEPEDFVIATGEMHSVRDFLAAAARSLGMTLAFSGKGFEEVATNEKGKVVVRVNSKFYRPVENDILCGDAAKAREKLDWSPTVSFEELATMMAKADLDRLRTEMGHSR